MKYSYNNFKKESTIGEVITASGRYRHDEINYSSILTKLIQEAGRWCESYASDLFIDWGAVIKSLENCENKSFLFGFKKHGVDYDKFIFSYFEKNGGVYYYRSIYRLDITVDEYEYITMELYRVGW